MICPYTILGELRFAAPVPAKNWPYVFDANKLPNACMQSRKDVFGNFSGTDNLNVKTPVSEDCLYLNVFAPADIKEVVLTGCISLTARTLSSIPY